MSAQIAHHVKITAGPSSHTPGALMQVQRFVTGLYTSVTTSLTLRVSHVACHHGSGIPHLWRSSPYWGFFVFIFFFFFCHVSMFPSDGTHLQTPLPACNTRTDFFSSCSSLERRWCVWERKRERREECGSNGSKPWWFQANAFQGQRWSESSRSDPAWRNMTRALDRTHGISG